MRIGILALQGAFAEHKIMLEGLGAECFEIRQLKDLYAGPVNGLVFPGGESTVMDKLLRESGLFSPLRGMLEKGIPVLATCAGLILLAEKKEDGTPPCFGTLPVTIRRNAYGRQLGSFQETAPFEGIGDFPMTFIRAPLIVSAAGQVKVLAVTRRYEMTQGISQEFPAAVRWQNQLAMSFHPELSGDPSVHAYFLNMVQNAASLSEGRPA